MAYSNKKVEKLRGLDFDDLRQMYRVFLVDSGLAKASIATAYTDTFYLWKNGGKELFWNTVLDGHFEDNARMVVKECLVKNSSGNIEKLINGYVSHLRRFRKFLEVDVVTVAEVKTHVAVKKVSQVKRDDSIPKPDKDQMEMYLERWDQMENYAAQEEALNKLFFKLAPQNKDMSDILLKVSTLNDFYSTNIFSTYPVAKHILELQIDDRLKAGDVTLVGDIQAVEISGKVKNFYSFATKYCSHHNPLDYPIYDDYVNKALRHFNKVDGFSTFSEPDLHDYVKFKSILIDFRSYYGLEDYNLKQIDQYLWQVGKEYFPKKY